MQSQMGTLEDFIMIKVHDVLRGYTNFGGVPLADPYCLQHLTCAK